MDWKEVGKTLLKAAPLVGGILGGPFGATVGTVANMAASALGVEATPDAIMAELKNNPEAMLKIKQFETENRTELVRIAAKLEEHRITQDTQRIMTVNETMRAESKSEHWPQWSWRPFWGFISALAFLAVCVFVCCLGYKAIVGQDSTAIGQIPLIIGAFSTLFTIPGAVLGISAWHRGKEKRIQLGDITALIPRN
jgi:hypothetical protein